MRRRVKNDTKLLLRYLRSASPMRRMSALGHKRTFAAQNGMSALPLKADMHEGFANIAYLRSAC
jgi:hypothetical protein